jgi:hypothetical protein
MSADKTRFIRFAKAGGNRGERSQMVMSDWGEEERYSDRVQQGGGNGIESCFVAARNGNGDEKRD